MSATTAWVLPEKYAEDLKDENGEPMSKRCEHRSGGWSAAARRGCCS
jgi:hypothetical protein